MKKTTLYISILLIDGLLGQYKPHYPFPHNENHAIESNCRSYAMAYSLPGSHCPVGMVDKIGEIDTRLFTPKIWDIFSVKVGDLVLWGEDGSTHAAVITKIKGRNSLYDIIVTHKHSGTGPIESNVSLDWVCNNTSAITSIETNITGRREPTHFAIKTPGWELKVKNRYSSGITGGKIGIKHGFASIVEEDSPYSDKFAWGSRIKITSVNRNATSWIDPQYILTNGYSNDLLLYDVSPFYATESTNAKIDWTVSFGEDFDSDDFFKKRENEQYSIPNEFNLGQNYPNPFNPTTTIKYELPEASSVSISIYDIRGNEVKTWENVNEQPGFKQITWQAIDNHGNKVPAGVYIYKLTATSHETNKVFSKSMKMVLLK